MSNASRIPVDQDEPVEARPFLKWAGGKAQLIHQLRKRLPPKYNRYFEPFIGGGALFFSLGPAQGSISDINDELVNCYSVIQQNVEPLIRDLRKHRYQKAYFYRTRQLDRTEGYAKLGNVERASRLIFLNKTCFNGLYRVNSEGQFNVPFGDYTKPKIVDEENLRACSAALARVRIACESFLAVEGRARRGDLVYFDPPYAPLSTTSNFTTYSKGGFGPADQAALRDLCVRLDKQGVHFMLSNSSAPLILDLYSRFNLQFVQATRAINSKAEKRGKVKEAIITNY